LPVFLERIDREGENLGALIQTTNKQNTGKKKPPNGKNIKTPMLNAHE
jgi:hypothetical protein